MKDVVFQAKKLTLMIKQSNEYNQYQRLRTKLAEDAELYRKVNEFRKRNFQLQNGQEDVNLFNEIEGLKKEYEGVLMVPVVNDFFVAEQRVCRLMQEVYTSLSEALDFDYEFFEE